MYQRWGFPSGRRFASCPRGGGRLGTGAGCRFTSQDATRHRYQVGKGRCGHTFLHPEVPGIQSVSPGYGLDIRQSTGWTKVCGTTRSGIWVLKGNARTRMLPENLDHLRVGWISRERQGTTVCVHKKDVPTGVNLNQYAGSGSFIRWHGDNEPLFGPQNLPKLIVSVSLGNSVEFMVRRRASGNVPSSIRLDHGDVLVVDGLAQSECEHCTASELQGPRVNLTFRWDAQHTASCPLAGVVGCVLPTCAQGLVEPSSRWLGEGENKWSSSWGIGPPFVNPCVCPSVQHLDSH